MVHQDLKLCTCVLNGSHDNNNNNTPPTKYGEVTTVDATLDISWIGKKTSERAVKRRKKISEYRMGSRVRGNVIDRNRVSNHVYTKDESDDSSGSSLEFSYFCKGTYIDFHLGDT